MHQHFNRLKDSSSWNSFRCGIYQEVLIVFVILFNNLCRWLAVIVAAELKINRKIWFSEFFSLTKYVELLTNSCRYISCDLKKYSIPNLFIINFDNCRIFHFEDAFIGIYVHVSPPFESLSLHLNSNSNFLSNPLIGYFVYYYSAKFKRVLKILWRTHDMKREKKFPKNCSSRLHDWTHRKSNSYDATITFCQLEKNGSQINDHFGNNSNLIPKYQIIF